MSGVNRVILMGRLGKDPETRFTADGTAVCNFSLATSYKKKSGDEVTEWHKCSAFDKKAELVDKYIKKGDMLYVEGQLATRKWQDKDGQDRYTTEIQVREIAFTGGNKRDDDEPRPTQRVTSTKSAKPHAGTPGGAGDMDEDIPF